MELNVSPGACHSNTGGCLQLPCNLARICALDALDALAISPQHLFAEVQKTAKGQWKGDCLFKRAEARQALLQRVMAKAIAIGHRS